MSSTSCERRGQGIGSALLAHAEAFARERGASTLHVWFYQYGTDDAGTSFLKHRGYTEYQRRQTSHLDLDTFDVTQFAESVASVERQGIHILSYAELPDL